jgi:hypothetical protein
MMNRIEIQDDAFDHYPYKQARERSKVLREAQKYGIVDVDPAGLVSTVLASHLIKNHGEKAYMYLEKRIKAQEGIK